MNETATKETWKNIPIDNPKRIVIDLIFTVKQFSKLILGLIPQQMEDKWFIYYEKERLYFYRSWTGNKIYNKTSTGCMFTLFVFMGIPAGFIWILM
jgi:ADP-ribosyl-[dinitrogen reductase] hydrolase